jgi:hypothetical protein
MGNAQQCKNDCKCDKSSEYDDQVTGDINEDKPVEVVDMTGLNVEDKHVKGVPATAGSGGSEKRRPQFEVTMERTGSHWRTLGLLVSPDDDPRHLVVDDVWEPSLISEWNKAQDDSKKVRPGDMIVSVNGIRSNGETMLEQIQSSGKGSTLILKIE